MSKIEVNTVDVQCGSNLTVGSSGKTITAPGNDIRSNAYKASDGGNIVSQSGTTITLGASGDTITLACGASQTGFGQAVTGVEYCTTAKTSPFTAVSQKGYFVNTTSGAVTVTLPASPSAGDVVAIADYANTFGNNNVTICRNSSKIDGQCSNATISQSSVSQTLVYVDATKGWKSIQKQESGVSIPTTFITATGGTETTCGDFKIHTFTSDGTFNVTGAASPNANSKVDFVIVGGGGGGGGPSQAGGGGAGGYRESQAPAISGCYTASPLSVAQSIQVEATSYPVIVGAGGTGSAGSPNNFGSNGGNSIFSTLISAGGGRGSRSGGPEPFGTAGAGGSGGGGGEQRCGNSGNVPATSPPQGNDGGDSTSIAGGGGGGATAVGSNNVPGPAASAGAAGGAGATSSITGSPVARAGGGGGGCGGGSGGTGGTGGGGNGGAPTGGNGTANTGGGGGGGGSPGSQGGTGGSGVVILRYKYQ